MCVWRVSACAYACPDDVYASRFGSFLCWMAGGLNRPRLSRTNTACAVNFGLSTLRMCSAVLFRLLAGRRLTVRGALRSNLRGLFLFGAQQVDKIFFVRRIE